MLRLPNRFAAVILVFSPLFVQQRTWGAISGVVAGSIAGAGSAHGVPYPARCRAAPGAALYPPPAHLSVTWKPAK